MEDLPLDHYIVRYNKGLREQLLPHENGQPQRERGLFAAKVRTAYYLVWLAWGCMALKHAVKACLME